MVTTTGINPPVSTIINSDLPTSIHHYKQWLATYQGTHAFHNALASDTGWWTAGHSSWSTTIVHIPTMMMLHPGESRYCDLPICLTKNRIFFKYQLDPLLPSLQSTIGLRMEKQVVWWSNHTIYHRYIRLYQGISCVYVCIVFYIYI